MSVRFHNKVQVTESGPALDRNQNEVHEEALHGAEETEEEDDDDDDGDDDQYANERDGGEGEEGGEFGSTGQHSSRASPPSDGNQVSPQQLFETLYGPYPHRVARDTSRRERREMGYISMSLVYGEIAFQPFQGVLDILKRWHHVLTKPGGVFLDIGSGSGKAVFAAALAHDFDACHGIEILEGLHAISQSVLHDGWTKQLKKRSPAVLSMQKKRTRITFTQGDALEVDWPDAHVADLVFLNSTCFGAVLLRELTRKLHAVCKPGAIIISATHELPDTQNFDHLRALPVEQEAWGQATWFLHRVKC